MKTFGVSVNGFEEWPVTTARTFPELNCFDDGSVANVNMSDGYGYIVLDASVGGNQHV